MVNLMDIIKRRDKIKNARDYLLDEIGSQTEIPGIISAKDYRYI